MSDFKVCLPITNSPVTTITDGTRYLLVNKETCLSNYYQLKIGDKVKIGYEKNNVAYQVCKV